MVDHVRSLARSVFGIDQLLPHQVQAIIPALRGRTVIVHTPTGSGKTACLLLPQLVARRGGNAGVTFVIDPTLSLIQNSSDKWRPKVQNSSDKWRPKGIDTIVFASITPRAEEQDALRALHRLALHGTRIPEQLVVVTPQRLVQDHILSGLVRAHGMPLSLMPPPAPQATPIFATSLTATSVTTASVPTISTTAFTATCTITWTTTHASISASIAAALKPAASHPAPPTPQGVDEPMDEPNISVIIHATMPTTDLDRSSPTVP